jgi:uncharacterized repeat protein (TIGR03803 family)
MNSPGEITRDSAILLISRSAASFIFIASLVAWLGAARTSTAAGIVVFEAESGTLGSNFTNGTDGATQFISISTDTVNSGNPGNANRVATYTVNFPEAGTYNLFARVLVGPGGFNDDSMFYGNGFGAESPTTDASWIFINGLAAAGFTSPGDIVIGAGSVGNLVWKWVNLSQMTNGGGEAPITFTVPAGNLTQTFQIGARENGLELDKFAFGTVGISFAVSNLDAGTLPPVFVYTNTFPGPDGMTLHRFSPLNNNLNADGANPAAGLAFANGVLCGTTLLGGTQGAGTAFYLSADGSNFFAFRTFTNAPDAGNPQGELSVAGNGFFGTSSGGGGSGVGSVFVGQTNGNLSAIRSFLTVSADNATNSGGASPSALIALSSDTLFGTASAGGMAANGTVFSLTTNGVTYSVLHDFSLLDAQAGTNSDGALPWGGLVLSGNTLYGTASSGGAGGHGVVFSILTNGGSFTVLHHFSTLDTITGTNADGATPLGGLVLSGNILYGTTCAGGQNGRGTLFSIQTGGLGFTVLHHFTATDASTGTNTDGASPSATLILSTNVLYGTTSAGGGGAAGTVFSLNLSGTRFSTLHSFSALSGSGTNADGAFPVAPVLRQGNLLYGTAFAGGPGAAGTVFSVPLPSPAIITAIVQNPDKSVTLSFLGVPNSTNVVQSATSLAPPVGWQNVSTNVADGNGVWQFTNFNPIISPQFYRSYAH